MPHSFRSTAYDNLHYMRRNYPLRLFVISFRMESIELLLNKIFHKQYKRYKMETINATTNMAFQNSAESPNLSLKFAVRIVVNNDSNNAIGLIIS